MNFLLDFVTNNITWMIIWGVVFVIALIVEFSTTQLVSIWFCGSSLIAFILALCNVTWWVQLIVFAVVSAILLVVANLFIRNKLQPKDTPTNSDSLIGQEIVITKVPQETEFGEGKIRDIVWSVSLANPEDVFEEGEVAIIKKIVGNHLVIEKKGN